MTTLTNLEGAASKASFLSAQEEAIQSGRKTVHGTATDRILRLFESINPSQPPRVTVERAVLFTESFKETEGQPLVLRWAKALKHFADKAPVTIFDDELIVGRPNTWIGRWAIVYPELDGSVMPAGVEMFRKIKGKVGEVVVTDEDKKIIDEVLTPYWAGKDYMTAFHRELPEETRFMMFGPDPKNTLLWTCVVLATSPMRHSQNWTPDFSKILTRRSEGPSRGGANETGSSLRPTRRGLQEAVPGGRHPHLRRHDRVVPTLRPACAGVGREGNKSATEKRTSGNRRGVRVGP